MKVTIGCQGRFHLFDLARQMERLGHLEHLYTGYPRYKIDDLPRKKVSTFPWLMAPYMAAGRFGLGSYIEKCEQLIVRSFDDWVARNIEDCDVYHCLSGSGVRAHQLARDRYGALTICDRGSAHILYQDRILREEFERQGLPFGGIDQGAIERELAEYDLCDLVVTPSGFALQSFVELGVPPNKLRKSPLGVDLKTYRPVPKEDRVFRVIYVGSASLQKGIPYLLQAVSNLRLPNFETWLIGSVFPEVKSILSRHEGWYCHLGRIDRRRLHWFYSQGSVFVLPSIQDGFGMVQAEAMACGLPVIATANTGAKDLFTDGVEGFIVPIRDPEALQDKLLSLYRNPELRNEMSRAALRRVQEIGGWNEYGERTLRLYEKGLQITRTVKGPNSALRGQLGPTA